MTDHAVLYVAREHAASGVMFVRLAYMAARRGDWRAVEHYTIAGRFKILDARFVVDSWVA